MTFNPIEILKISIYRPQTNNTKTQFKSCNFQKQQKKTKIISSKHSTIYEGFE